MKKALSFVPVMFFLFIVPIDAQNQAYNPEVPRISVFEAYTEYKAGKAILIHAGGELFERRHIVGAFNVDAPAVLNKGRPLPNIPMRGIEIIIYCY